MNKYVAAGELESIGKQYNLNELQKEALEEGILALYKLHIQATNAQAIALRCKKCRNVIFLESQHADYDNEYEFTTFTAACPHCGREYEWNNCYWR